jgi:proton-translocating NADH-quinone oxidoreductase chain N
MINVADMLTFYLLIELQALVFYVLASFKRDSSFSVEAGLKYFIIGSFISGIFLFGCSLIYFSIGTLNFNNISVLLYTQFPLEFIVEYQLLLLGVLLVTFVFLFKVLAAPFHFWSPDVYEGAPLSTTIIFSILPKLSIFYIFVKWMSIVIIFEEIRLILLFSGFLSILLGSFWAFKQKRLKRLIIYSSLAQLGFLISVLSSYSVNAYASLYFFLFVYLITSILIWNYYSLLATFQKEINNFFENSFKPLYVTVFTSFFKVNTTWAFSFLIIFFSLAGIPPFVGFLSKFFVLVSLLEFGNFFSSFSLLMISSISVFYYLRIVKIVYFENIPNFKIELSQIIFSDYYYFSNCFLLAILLYLLLFFSFFPSFLLLISKLIVLGSYFF